jgi:hypothetical protein
LVLVVLELVQRVVFQEVTLFSALLPQLVVAVVEHQQHQYKKMVVLVVLVVVLGVMELVELEQQVRAITVVPLPPKMVAVAVAVLVPWVRTRSQEMLEETVVQEHQV